MFAPQVLDDFVGANPQALRRVSSPAPGMREEAAGRERDERGINRPTARSEDAKLEARLERRLSCAPPPRGQEGRLRSASSIGKHAPRAWSTVPHRYCRKDLLATACDASGELGPPWPVRQEASTP